MFELSHAKNLRAAESYILASSRPSVVVSSSDQIWQEEIRQPILFVPVCDASALLERRLEIILSAWPSCHICCFIMSWLLLSGIACLYDLARWISRTLGINLFAVRSKHPFLVKYVCARTPHAEFVLVTVNEDRNAFMHVFEVLLKRITVCFRRRITRRSESMRPMKKACRLFKINTRSGYLKRIPHLSRTFLRLSMHAASCLQFDNPLEKSYVDSSGSALAVM